MRWQVWLKSLLNCEEVEADRSRKYACDQIHINGDNSESDTNGDSGMRRFEQKQLVELADTMDQAVSMLEQLYAAGEWDTFQEILTGQQEAAISIGTRLENMLRSGDVCDVTEEDTQIGRTVALLEQYCELVWNVSNIREAGQLAEAVGSLQETMNIIRSSLQKLPVRTEVVFLPYKASMWDCMETVWEAAMADEDCDVYVVPIPYFDLNQDGSKGAMRYEGALMPSKVPVTDFRNYKIEERRPDIVYIHNPYDEYNKVTSVHPDYYSSRLCHYTDMLVYIPYFLPGEHLAETHSLLPAYVYADKIVLSAETMIDDIDPSIPREKFIIAGSPKAERLVRMEQNKESVDIPAEWKEKIRDRKVVFYNLSISGLLKYREKMLAKMAEVFDVFEKRQDVVILYRPHPLIESTLTSMCPELLKDYHTLVRRVQAMSNAIYDTTPDASVAVVLSDAYIGETSSSITAMFKVLGKPLLYLNEKMYYQPTPDEMLSERTFDVCRVGDELWFVTYPLQMLCKYSLADQRIEYVTQLPEVENDGCLRYVNVVYDQEHHCLIMVPYRGEALCIYNLEKGTFRKDYFRPEYVNSCFGRAFQYGRSLFLTPINYPAIVRYDMDTGEFEYFTDCISQAYKMIPEAAEGNLFIWGVGAYGQELYLASPLKNLVLTFHMETGEYRIDAVGKETDKYRGMAVDETYCWMILCDSPAVVRWNRQTGETVEYAEFPEGFEAGEVPFKNIVDMGDALYLIPCHANWICRLDKEKGIITKEDFDLPYEACAFRSEYFEKAGAYYDFGKKISDREIAACALYDDSLIVLNTEQKTAVTIPIRFEQRLSIEVFKKDVRTFRECWESNGMPLNKYLGYVREDLLRNEPRRGIPKQIFDEWQNVGAEIHSAVKGCCSVSDN